MTDGPEAQRYRAKPLPDQSVESLANRALDELARRRVTAPKVLKQKYVDALRDAVLDRGPDARARTVARLLSDGVSAESLLDHYIPEVARDLGERWARDTLGFADVTIGTARLQGLVRELLRDISLPAPKGRANDVAVIVLADEYHTLGALVLTSQLRRLGISVRLLMGVREDEMLREVTADRYDAVLISASHSESLEKLSRFVEKIRKQTERNTPIAIGGPLLDVTMNVKAATGADVATSDVMEAVRQCRLKISHIEGHTSKVTR